MGRRSPCYPAVTRRSNRRNRVLRTLRCRRRSRLPTTLGPGRYIHVWLEEPRDGCYWVQVARSQAPARRREQSARVVRLWREFLSNHGHPCVRCVSCNVGIKKFNLLFIREFCSAIQCVHAAEGGVRLTALLARVYACWRRAFRRALFRAPLSCRRGLGHRLGHLFCRLCDRYGRRCRRRRRCS